ncbi:gluconokinase [Pedobacter sp. CAN_A7]|uniref:gluconokinase n=1 Tax=Pedobacter sp. CAN_A7 TaxID=2787722 RepID=UPI0018C9B6EB
MEYIVGVDIGTGSVKAVAVDLSGNSFEVDQQHYSYQSQQPDYHEQDAEEIWLSFQKSLQAIVQKIGYQPKAISLSAAMHSVIAVDESGNALSPMITWADSRSAAVAKKLKNSSTGLAIYQATGTPIHAMSPLCKLIWLKENDQELFKTTHKFISIKEYIWFKLFKEFVIDYSIASCTGMFDIEALTWHLPALTLAGIASSKLSLPVPTNYCSKTPALNMSFLNEDIPFIIGASDGCLANLGCMAYHPGQAVMTIGTSGAIRIASNKPLPNTEAMTFSYILDKDTYICGGPINNGGITLQWWLKNHEDQELDDDDFDSYFKQIQEIPAGSNGLLFLPYLTGERAPIWDSESCGTFFGVKLAHQKTHFSRAVLEGVCYAMKDVLEAVQVNAAPIKQIYISGGFVKSEVWVQLLANITGKELVIVQTEDASAIGAAFLAMKTLNLIQVYPEVMASDFEIIKPDLSLTAFYLKNFTIFKKVYFDLKETMHEFHLLNH